MTRKNIERAIAKDELIRLDEILDSPYLLIGGLAVQQYCTTRISKDIDLICDFETVQDVIDKLYPTDQWNQIDSMNDDYRPSYILQYRFSKPGDDKIEIFFGPKVLERGGYEYIEWEELSRNARPFKHKKETLSKILVPLPHALAYSKLVSFSSRQEAMEEKINQDISDFANLTNHHSFSLAEFWDLLNSHDPHGTLRERFRTRISRYADNAKKSCLYGLSMLFIDLPQSFSMIDISQSLPKPSKHQIYIAAPHKNVTKNKGVAESLRSHGLLVKVPLEEVDNSNLSEQNKSPEAIRQICTSAIDSCDIVAVDLDTYGLDSAWELGYAEGLNKAIVGYSLEPDQTTERYINRRIYNENFMHGWLPSNIYYNESGIIEICKNKVVYICGSFDNKEIDKLRASSIKTACKELIDPKEHVKNRGDLLPKDYPLNARRATNDLLRRSDILLVVLPRYGMDASWQIGYAFALKKQIIGFVLNDDKRQVVHQSFWDHWVHGWKQKTHLVSITDLVAFLRGMDRQS